MPRDMPFFRGLAACAAACAIVSMLSGCQAPALQPPPPVTPVATAACPAPMVMAVPLPVTTPPSPCPPSVASLALAQGERLRGLSVPELAQEVSRLTEPGEAPLAQMQLAQALLLTKVPADAQRAQGILQRLLQNTTSQADALRPLARQLLAQYAEQRRLEEQIERQAQQLRDAQRRIDQLNERLEAVRAIERSLSAPAATPAPGSSAPANGQRPSAP
jgi:hypothetical protein